MENLIYGVPVDRVKEICAAEKEGRCVVLLPIDQSVFIIQDGRILEFRVYEYSLLSVNGMNTRYWAECVTDEDEDCLDFWQDDIGVCVFFTRETAEAEAALKEREEH